MSAPATPDDSEPLPTAPEVLLARLGALGIATVTHEHPPLFTVAESQALRGTLPGGHCKSLLLDDRKGTLWLVVALEHRRLDLKRLHLTLGCGRLSFASSAVLWQTLGVRPGSVTPFGLINDRECRLRVALDQDMMDFDPLNYHPLVNTRTTAIAPDGLLRFIVSCGHTPRLVVLDNTPSDSSLSHKDRHHEG